MKENMGQGWNRLRTNAIISSNFCELFGHLIGQTLLDWQAEFRTYNGKNFKATTLQ